MAFKPTSICCAWKRALFVEEGAISVSSEKLSLASHLGWGLASVCLVLALHSTAQADTCPACVALQAGPFLFLNLCLPEVPKAVGVSDTTDMPPPGKSKYSKCKYSKHTHTLRLAEPRGHPSLPTCVQFNLCSFGLSPGHPVSWLEPTFLLFWDTSASPHLWRGLQWH